MQSLIPAIDIIDAQLRYANHRVFSKLCLHLAAGQFSCLLGPSGVGKSSLLRLIAGLIKPETQVAIKCSIATSDKLSLNGRVAYLAQDDGLLPWLSTLDNIVIADRLQGKPPDYAHASALLKRVGLAQASTLRPNQLSGGMRQRAALARTLYQETPVVLLDEPFSALDTMTRLKLQDLTSELLSNKTVLMITHDPLEALRLGDEIFILHGSPATIKTLPRLPSKPPRCYKNDELMHWHAWLLEELRSPHA